MRTMGRRTGVTALASLYFCICLVGCLTHHDEFLQVHQPSAPNSVAARGPAASGYPNQGGVFAAPVAAMGQVQQTAYRPGSAPSRSPHAMPDGNYVVHAQAITPAPQGITPSPMETQQDNGTGPFLGAPQGTVLPSQQDFGAPPPPGFDGPRPLPNELVPTSHPPYRVAPPDILLIDALRVVPRGPYRLEPLEVLQINVSDTLPNQPITGPFMITPEGTVNLGFTYGSVRVGGLTLEQAQQSIFNYLSNILKNPTVNLGVTQFRGMQQVAGQHLVRPDGTISLGSYGSVYVAGLTLGQIKCVLEKYLSEYLINPQVSVDVLAYNSQKIYVILDGGGFGQQVVPLPVTGNETVLDALSSVNGLAPVSSKKKIWVARPSPCHQNCNVILPVDWQAITMNGQTCTNYQLFPGDRVYVAANGLIQFDNYLSQFLSPIERIMGAILLGSSVAQSFNSNGGNNSALFVP